MFDGRSDKKRRRTFDDLEEGFGGGGGGVIGEEVGLYGDYAGSGLESNDGHETTFMPGPGTGTIDSGA